MKKPTKLLLAAALTGAAGLAGLSPAFAHDHGDKDHQRRGDHRRGEMMHQQQMGGPGSFLRLACAPQASTRLENMLGRLGERLNLSSDQQTQLDDLKTAALTAQTKLSDDCAQPGAAADTNLVDRMKQRQQNMQAYLDAMDSVMPKLESFYASLSDSQKAQLDQPMRNRFGERGKWGGMNMPMRPNMKAPGQPNAPQAPATPQSQAPTQG